MSLYIHPKKEEERMMDHITVPFGSSHRVHEKFMTAIHMRTSKRAWGIPAIIFSGAMAVFAFMMAAQTDSSFIAQAIAASQAKVAMMQDGDVRHVVTVTSPDPFSSISYEDIHDSTLSDEWWLSGDGKSYAFAFSRGSRDNANGTFSERKIILNGEEYVTPEKYNLYNAEMQFAAADSTDAENEDVRTDIQIDEAALVLNEGASLGMRIQDLLGFGVQRNVVPNITGALEELATSSLVKDLGEQKREDLGRVHVYSLSYLDDRFDTADVIIQGIDYVFDAETKELKEIGHWVQFNDEAPRESSVTKIVTDEVVSLKSLAINPFDPTAHGLVAMAEDSANYTNVASYASMINPYGIQNFNCKSDCQNLVVVEGVAPLFSDPTCVKCTEILLWANMSLEKDVITLMGEANIQGKFVSFPDQILLLSDYPNWEGQTFPVSIKGTDTVLSVILRQTNEDNLIADVECVSGCANIKVGVHRDYFTELLIDTCPPKPCEMFSLITLPIMENNVISEDGILEGDSWKGGYSVSVWRIPSLFAFNDDHGEEIARVDYSPDQTTDGQTLHFDQVVDGHRFTFDLVSALP